MTTRNRILAALGFIAIALAFLVPVIPADSQPARVFTAREHTTQQVSYYRKLVNFNDAGIASAVQFGILPSGASITGVSVEIVTAFNAVTTNVLTVGTTTTATEMVAAGDVDETATGYTVVTRGLGRSLTASAAAPLYVKYTQSGTAATAGVAIITVTFIQNNDL